METVRISFLDRSYNNIYFDNDKIDVDSVKYKTELT